jgi:tetratricopeptide (TPR) repeat protein
VPLAAAAATLVVFGLALGFGATAVVIAALLVGLGAALWQARRAVVERDRAIALADRNAAVNIFLDTLLTRAARAGPMTAAQLLERSEQLIDNEIKDNAEHRAYVFGVLANYHRALDNPARSAQLLERAMEAARGIADTALRDSLASRHAVVRGQLGKMDEAIAATEAILAKPNTHPEVRSETHSHRGQLASWVGDQAGALKHATEALHWYRMSRRMSPRQEPVLLGDLGWAHMMQGQGEEADLHFSEAMAVYERLGLADSPTAVQLMSTVALAQQEMGDLPRSLELFDRGLAVTARAAPEASPSPYLLANRAYTLTQMGRYADAEAGYRLGVAVARQQGAALIVYSIRMCLVELFAEQERVEDGKRELNEADAECDVEVPEGTAARFARQLADARLMLLRGSPDAAVAVFSQMLEDMTPSAGNINALLGRAGALLLSSQNDAAMEDARKALDFARRLQGSKPASFRTGLACLMMARIHDRRGDLAAVSQSARTAVEQLAKGVDRNHPALSLAHRLAVSPTY